MTKNESEKPEKNSAFVTWDKMRERWAGIRAGTIKPNKEEKRILEKRAKKRAERKAKK